MRLGPTQLKIILLLLGGLALSCSFSPKTSFRVVKLVHRGWRDINKKNLNRSLRLLYTQQLVTDRKNPDGSISLILTPEGKRQATLGQLLGLKIKKPKRWDLLWRIVLFDIPEKHKKFRDIFRSHLKAIGFHELQHSVFVFPFPCEKEILSLVKLYHATPYVRFITAKHIDNESTLKKKFSL